MSDQTGVEPFSSANGLVIPAGYWVHVGATDTIKVCVRDGSGTLADGHFRVIASV